MRRDSLHRPDYISQTTGPRRILHFTRTTAGFDFLSDHCLCCGVAFGLYLSPDARNGVAETIADRTLAISFLEINRNSQVALFKLNFPGIIHDGAVTVAAKFIFLAAKFESFYLGLCHRAHSGERYRLAFRIAAGAEDRIFLTSFTDRTAVR